MRSCLPTCFFYLKNRTYHNVTIKAAQARAHRKTGFCKRASSGVDSDHKNANWVLVRDDPTVLLEKIGGEVVWEEIVACSICHANLLSCERLRTQRLGEHPAPRGALPLSLAVPQVLAQEDRVGSVGSKAYIARLEGSVGVHGQGAEFVVHHAHEVVAVFSPSATTDRARVSVAGDLKNVVVPHFGRNVGHFVYETYVEGRASESYNTSMRRVKQQQ